MIPSIIVYLIVLLNVSKHRFSPAEIIVYVLIIYLASVAMWVLLAYMSIDAMFGDLLGNIIITVCTMVFMYRKTKHVMLSGNYALFATLIALLGNALVAVIVGNLTNQTIFDLRDDVFPFMVSFALTIPVCFISSRLIGNQLHESYTQLSPEVKNKLLKNSLILSASTYVLSHVNFFIYRAVEYSMFEPSINIILITSIFFIAVITMAIHSRSQQKELEAAYMEKSLEDLSESNRKLTEAYDNIRSYHHDHHNLLHALIGFSSAGDLNGLNKYLAQTLAYSKDILNKLDDSQDRLKYIHIPELKGLLSVKFAHALANDIELEIDIADPVKEVPVNKLELCRLVGIMVDNAIEELLSKDYDHKFLKFGILLEEGEILIVCTNPCKIPPDVEKIFEKGYSARGHGKGIGLYNLKKISKKCGNVIASVYPKKDEFIIVLTIRQV